MRPEAVIHVTSGPGAVLGFYWLASSLGARCDGGIHYLPDGAAATSAACGAQDADENQAYCEARHRTWIFTSFAGGR
jgi:hypothetical protein